MSQPDIKWDGRTYPYIPSKTLKIDPKLKLHTRAAEKIDPVTYEVVRHAMWNINVEHGNTIMRISGSPSCAYGHDFNPSLHDENGDFVFFGPFLQYLSSATGSAIKWTMENRSDNPGIADGDIFLTDDPWIGATHQSDVALVAPVFWEGELFCWVGNTLHQWDMSGTAPGGFNPMAADVFWESGCIPPIKIVEGGKLRTKLRKARLRKSAKQARRKVDTANARRIAEGLLLTDGVFACSKCGSEICATTENYKRHCAMTERPITDANPYLLNPKVYIDDKIVFRSYACPSCGLLIQTELVRPTDPPLWDIQLA